MNVTTAKAGRGILVWGQIALLGAASMAGVLARAQDSDKAREAQAKADGEVVGDNESPAPAIDANATPEERSRAAWKLLSAALKDSKRPQTQIQGLAAVGMLRSAEAEKMIQEGMADPDLDVRTAAALAAGESKDRNLTTPLRNLLDDKEPQVVFTAAMTLWKMGDRSGEDVLMSVVDGDRSANPTMMHGTEHKISRDLHDPAKLARLGAMQGAFMLLGPFGFGITALQYMHSNGGDAARSSAIEAISQERTEPIHHELVAALEDKDPSVRAAAAKGLVMYHDKPTQMAVYALLTDNKQPVRLTAAAAYLRTAGVAGPPIERDGHETEPARERRRPVHPVSTKPMTGSPVR